jgi:hypothetical protein
LARCRAAFRRTREFVMFRFSGRGAAGLVAAAAVVAVMLIGIPAVRPFFLISVAAGVVIAAGLRLWHKYRPIREEDVDDHRPLKLD